jgi:16S rRNA (guanine966-N2)-methyltransferase
VTCLRIISGTARGRRLRSPKDNSVRPTSDKIKESIFNIIQFEIEGRRVLDLFSGTGQMGIEALSRGASEAVLVDLSPVSAQLCRQNAALAGLPATVVCSSALDYLSRTSRRRFDLIFLDPPYEKGIAAKTLQRLDQVQTLSPYGSIVAETASDEELPQIFSTFALHRRYRYGQTIVWLYRSYPTEPDSADETAQGEPEQGCIK